MTKTEQFEMDTKWNHERFNQFVADIEIRNEDETLSVYFENTTLKLQMLVMLYADTNQFGCFIQQKKLNGVWAVIKTIQFDNNADGIECFVNAIKKYIKAF